MRAYLNLHSQDAPKLGSLNNSASFLKATTTTLLHTVVDESEKESYVAHINSYLRDDPFMSQFLPIDPATNELCELARYGVLLCIRMSFTNLTHRMMDNELFWRGQCIGMLFRRDAHTWIPSRELNSREMAVAAQESSRLLQVSSLAKAIRVLAKMEEQINTSLFKYSLGFLY